MSTWFLKFIAVFRRKYLQEMFGEYDYRNAELFKYPSAHGYVYVLYDMNTSRTNYYN